jgi:putative protein-disulfide isomerase
MVTIHYFFDPMCGWCYGATPLADIANSAQNVKLVMHPGGMVQRREMDASFRNMATTNDKRIAEMTGQEFTAEYYDRLKNATPLIFDSYLTAQAIWVMEQHYNQGFEMLKAIQQAHYQSALDSSDPVVLSEIAVGLGAKKDNWFDLMKTEEVNAMANIEKSQKLMNQWSVNGFPTFILESEGKLSRLPHSNFYGNATQWLELVDGL